MTKSQLLEKLATSSGVTKKQANAVVESLVATIVGSVRKSEPVKVPGLGIFKKVKTKARMGRNPQTGEAIKIPARTKARFTMAKVFKESVLGAKK